MPRNLSGQSGLWSSVVGHINACGFGMGELSKVDAVMGLIPRLYFLLTE